jgi:RNA-directed DNA polymerase
MRRGIIVNMRSKKKRMQSLTKSLQNSRTPVVTTDERVRMLQRKLYLKAKQDKTFKFYVLYDKIRLDYFLQEAYRRVKANGGAPGIDGVTFKQIEKDGRAVFLENIKRELINKTYKAQAVRRVYIPKANGKLRPLGIPSIKCRVVQMCVKMVIEPIFEADFCENSFGFRPKRNAKQAMAKIKGYLKEKRTHVLDADLEGYFDTIPHDKLLIVIKQRISDKNILALIMQWLKCPVIDQDNKTSGGKNNKVGTPQGGVISPLLSNIYLNLYHPVGQDTIQRLDQ